MKRSSFVYLVRKFLFDVSYPITNHGGRNLPLQGRRFDCGVELGCSDKRGRRSQDR